jgi:hypothetical protein
VKADQIGSEHSHDHIPRDRVGEALEAFGTAPGRVGEVKDGLLRAGAAHETGGQGQVVVLEQDQGLGLGEGQRGLRETGIDGLVAGGPGSQLALTEVLDAELVPETVDREPQHAVGGVVVVTGVDLGIEIQQVQ